MADQKRVPLCKHPPNVPEWWSRKLAGGQTILEQSASAVDLELRETGAIHLRFDVYRGDQMIVAALTPGECWHFLNGYAEGYLCGLTEGKRKWQSKNENS